MSSAERGLEEQLVEAGNRLLKPPSSVDELLPLLDACLLDAWATLAFVKAIRESVRVINVENLLSRVEQSPSKSMQTALSPSMKALVADELLRHPDVDVKVAVASCISEITRITAPDAPYDDDRMKDVFQLIVSSFENLSDKSSISYNKRTLILETVAKVRSCVVMLDLECDGLIVEMFQHFLKAIRDYHPENVFSSMETIMTLVLEESEDISFELISPILASVKKDNEEVLPIARKLGKRVFENCAAKLKPYLIQAKKSLGLSLDDYSKIIASICNGTTGSVGHNDDNACGEQLNEESNLARASSEGAAQVKLAGASTDEAAEDRATKESVIETCPEGDHPNVDRSMKSAMSNGIKETGNGNRSVEPVSLKKLENAHQADQSGETSTTSNAKPDDLDGGEMVKSESKSEQTSKKRGRKPNSVINSVEPSDSSRVDSGKEAEKVVDHENIHSKEVCGSPPKEPLTEVAVPSENENETVEPSSLKALESEAINVDSPSPSGNVLDEGHQKKSGRPKKKENSIQEVAATADVKKASEGTSDSEVKPERCSGKKAPAESVTEEKAPAMADTSKIEGGTSDSETKTLKQAARKVDARDNTGDGSSSKKQQDGKRQGRGRGRGKVMLKNDGTRSSAKDDDKEMVPSPMIVSKLTKDEGLLEETPKTISKRKRTPGKEQASDTMKYDDSLVGKKVKVWWPLDKTYYYGIIDSFDSVKKRHKVAYRDGDNEVLNLRTQKFVILKDDSMSDEEGVTESQSPDPSPELHKRKKAKSNSELSAKQGKMEGSRGAGASSSKSKGTTATKSVRKSRDNEVDEKVKDSTLTSGGKSLNDTGGKSKDRSKKGSDKSVGAGDSEGKSKDRSKKGGDKSVGDASKSAGKSKDVDTDTLKTMTKAKLDSPKTATKQTPKTTSKETPKTASKGTPKAAKSKGKGSKRGKNSKASGSGKLKLGSVEEKEAEEKENSPDDTVKKPENTKVKSPDTSKAQEGTVVKSGKKRRRGVKS